MKRFRKTLTWAILSVSISLAVVMLSHLLSGGFDEFQKIPRRIFLLVGLSYVALYLIGGLGEYVFIRLLGYRISYIASLENFFFGNFFSYITPLYIGGQPFQIYHFTRVGVKSEDATNFVMTRLFETFMTTIVLSIAGARYAFGELRLSGISSVLLKVGFTLQTLWTFLILLFLLAPGMFSFILKPLLKPLGKSLTEWLETLKKSIKSVWKRRPYMIVVDSLFWLINVLIHTVPFYLVFRTLQGDFNMGFFKLTTLLALASTIAYYAPTPGASGGVEGTYQIVFSSIADPAVVASAVFVWRLFSFYAPIAVGLALSWRVKSWMEE